MTIAVRRFGAAVLILLAFVPTPATAAPPATLPLGDPDLVETRTVQQLAAGVTLTRIVRGTEPAPAAPTLGGFWRPIHRECA